MTRTELLQKRDQIIARLIAQGWDEDDARFAVLTAGANLDGLLADQPKVSSTPEVEELAAHRQPVRHETEVEMYVELDAKAAESLRRAIAQADDE